VCVCVCNSLCVCVCVTHCVCVCSAVLLIRAVFFEVAVDEFTILAVWDTLVFVVFLVYAILTVAAANFILKSTHFDILHRERKMLNAKQQGACVCMMNICVFDCVW